MDPRLDGHGKYVRIAMRQTPQDYFFDFVNADFETSAYLLFMDVERTGFFDDPRVPLCMFENATELIDVYIGNPFRAVAGISQLMDEDRYPDLHRYYMLKFLAMFYEQFPSQSDVANVLKVTAQSVWDRAAKKKKEEGSIQKKDADSKDEVLQLVHTAVKITITEVALTDLYEALSPYFQESQRDGLEKCLMGKGQDGNKLLFLEEGNKLADVFKQLYRENGFIGSSKKDVERWIERNFQYTEKDSAKDYTAAYLDKIISGSNNCKSPILKIRQEGNGHVIAPLPRNDRKNLNN
ncbi:hypothetical protein ACFQ4C_12020 [Larkinella insperata]|uniref:Uncharacterized protein n=1 Tax=Larkinella insperata TaxID=332158 RepID=A0ABW3QAG4_9BACT|nr:hypothetical protein [Larkinella insperata]